MKTYRIKPEMGLLVTLYTIYICEMFTEPHGGVTLDPQYLALNYIPVILFWLLLFALSNKALFSSVLSSLVVLGVVSVNNIKFDALGKPLMPSDFLLTGHLLNTPDLFIRYLNITVVLCIVVGAAATAAIFLVERQQFATTRYVIMSRLLVSAVALSFFAGIPSAESFVARTYNNNSLTYFSWDPSTSVGQSGFFYTFIRLSEGLDFSIPQDYGDPSIIQKTAAAALPAHKDTKRARQLPDIVVVQNEAFYDVRQHELQVAPEAYAKYDITAAQAAVSGNVVVPTVGGNTVKTEFSFLSGIETTILPSACEYPYRSLVRKNIWSIAWYLKSLGYTTVAIHPYHRTFWDRNIAYPFLGFDEFIDHTQFSRNMREGLFVSDRAVADKIREVTKRTSGPLFVFAVTMENHGPWDRARVANQRSIEINSKLDAQDRTQMERYLHHVANAGNMASMLAGQLGKSVRPSLFAFYGDHAPALTAVENIPFRKGGSIMQTPYFIWKNFGKREHVTRDTSVSFLASEILDQAGVNDDPYFRANSYMDEANGNSFTSKTDDVSRSYIQLLYNNLLGKLPAASFKTAKDTAGGKPQL